MKLIVKIYGILLIVAALHLAAEQKVVLISGATGGIGEAAIKTFDEKGWKVWAGYRTSILEKLKNRGNIHWIKLDVTNDEMIREAVSTIIKEEGKIDVLVNNAGYGIIGLEHMVTLEEARKLFDVNFFGAFNLIQHVVPHMQLKNCGRIINISSTSGVRAVPGLGLYAASKFALEGLSEAMAVTLSPWNIQLSLIEPGTVKNDFARHCVWNQEAAESPLAAKFCQNLTDKLISLAMNGQECEEIGRLILAVAETPNPNFRYQTSQKVEATLAKKLVDLPGNKMRDEQTAFFNALIE